MSKRNSRVRQGSPIACDSLARGLVAGVALLLVSAPVVDAQWTNRYPRITGYNHHVYLEGYELPTLTSGAIDPAVSPDGGSIAFASRGWIWVMDLETRHATRVTSGRDMDSRPVWSPDGETLALVRDNDHETSIVLIDASSGEDRLVLDSPALELDPAFSPDGGELYFSSAREGTLDLWAHDLTTGEERRLTDLAGIELRPQPGPAGLVYLAKRVPGGMDHVVWRPGAGGAGAGDVSLASASIMSLTRPALDPEGKIVAFGEPTQDGWELRLMRVDAPGPTILLAEGRPLTPAWSPDGEWVYFAEADEREQIGLKRVRRSGGPVEDVAVASEDWGVETARVRVRTVMDGRTVPARLAVLDASGHPVAPDASGVWFDGQGGRVFFYTDGVVDLVVPAGEVTVAAVQGLTTPEARGSTTATPGRLTEVTVELESVWEARPAGFTSGEHHFHLNYGGVYDLVPADLVPIMRGENLDFATPLLANLHNRFGDQPFWGRQISGDGPLVRFGQEVRSHFLGHLGLIEIPDLFWPWTWGPGYEVYGDDDRTNAEVLQFTRGQGGFGYYVHPVSRQDPFSPDGMGAIPIELIVDAVLGDLDAIELVCLWSDEMGTAEVWYRFLNLGIPVAASAGTDVMTDFFRTMAVGTTRVYARTGAARNWPAYMDALSAGRTFVTNGPMIDLRVNEAGPGEVVEAGDVDFVVDVRSAVPFERIELLVNGSVVATGDGLTSSGSTRLEGSLTLPEGGWVAARAVGGETTWPSMDSYPFAHASPVWIGERGSTHPVNAAEAAVELLAALEVARADLEEGYGGVAIPRLTARFDEARRRLEDLAGSR